MFNATFSNISAIFWGISCEKSRFYANNYIFSNFRGGAGCPPLDPPLNTASNAIVNAASNVRYRPLTQVNFFAILFMNKFKNLTNVVIGKLGWLGLWCLMPLSKKYFSYIAAVSFIGGGSRSTRRKPTTCHKSLTNYIT